MKKETLEYYHKNNIPIDWDALNIENREKLIDDVVNKWSYARVICLDKKDLLDAFTCKHIQMIKDNLKPENKKRFLSWDLYKIINFTWKAIEKCSEA